MKKSDLHVSGVYKITNTVTNQHYVGSSKDVQRRWWQHRSKNTWKTKNNQMYKDMKKYGVEKFKFELVYQCCEPLLTTFEQLLIKKENPYYNSKYASGRDGKKRAISDKRSGNKYREKHSESLKLKRNKTCNYKGHLCTLNALYVRFLRNGVIHPFIEAKKYVIGE